METLRTAEGPCGACYNGKARRPDPRLPVVLPARAPGRDAHGFWPEPACQGHASFSPASHRSRAHLQDPPCTAACICPRSAAEPSSADRSPPYLCPRGHPAPQQPRAPRDSHLGRGCTRGCNSCASSPSAAAGFISPCQQRGG